MRVKVRVDGKVEEIRGAHARRVKRALKDTSTWLYTHIVTQYLSGQALKVRSGTLRRSVHPVYEERGNKVIAGVGFGTKYAGTHIGKKGTYTVIKPKRAKFLAVPLPGALTPAGVARFKSPRDMPNSFIRKGVIYQETATGAVPMYVLKRQVKVPKRIDPAEVLGTALKRLKEMLHERV